jgi:multiple sugar transport system substrate-binding protein
MFAGLVGCLFLLSLGPASAGAGTLVINANTADPAPRAAWQAAVDRFKLENPDVAVEFNVYDHESYKKAIRIWLTGMPPDVVFWFGGNRMRQFAARGLLMDLSDLYAADARARMHPSALALVSYEGRQFGVPYTYYQVGLYYRRDVLAAAGVREPPATFGELVAACDKLKAAGIEPFAIGTRDLWPAAAWFDYLDLRENGYAFHMSLMEGAIAYTDPRVGAVFRRWRELLDRNCFSRNHASSSWQESQALLYQGKAGMMLIGNYIVANFPADVRDRMDFVRFPALRPEIGRFEEAPMNTVHVPAAAQNKEGAKRFMQFVMRADVQEELNKAMLQLPVNKDAAVADDRFLRQGRQLINEASALSQYFDRDTSEDLATIAMKGFQEFMLQPQRLPAILSAIESARQRIYGPLPSAAGTR